jgi:ribosome biogenesis GTPase / thiamine phosphate phosphatase
LELERLGWDSTFADAFVPYAAAGLVPARVVRQDTNALVIHGEDGELGATVSGRLKDEARTKAELPTVGDWVAVQPGVAGTMALVTAVLPRRSRFSRAGAGAATEEQVVAANIDTVFLVNGLDGDFNPRRIERYLILAYNSGARPVVVLSKSDLCDDVPARLAEIEAVAIGVSIHAVCGKTGDGLEGLLAHLAPGSTVAFLGSSGVGKSTMVNWMLGEARMKVREVREDDSRGRHTTSHRELLMLPAGAMVIDTPGMRELQMWGDADALGGVFADVEALAEKCKFRDCVHGSEPGCAVRQAVADGELTEQRLENYGKLKKEFVYLARREDEALDRSERNKRRKLETGYRKMSRTIQKRKR